MTNRKLMTIGAVSDRLGLSESTIYQWLRSGYLPGAKLGAQWRVDPQKLDDWIEERTPIDRGEGIESCEETPSPNYTPDEDLDEPSGWAGRRRHMTREGVE